MPRERPVAPEQVLFTRPPLLVNIQLLEKTLATSKLSAEDRHGLMCREVGGGVEKFQHVQRVIEGAHSGPQAVTIF